MEETHWYTLSMYSSVTALVSVSVRVRVRVRVLEGQRLDDVLNELLLLRPVDATQEPTQQLRLGLGLGLVGFGCKG